VLGRQPRPHAADLHRLPLIPVATSTPLIQKNFRNVKSITSCSADVLYVPASIKEDIGIMKTILAVLALGSLALMTTGANAYRSNANGTQAYPNPDRETYVNRSCCSWKSNHKAPHKVTVKH
jgi:hypothetical protein